MGQSNYRDGFAVRTHGHMLGLPSTWAKPRMVFVNSMGDLFHEEVPLEFIERVFAVMQATPRHTYQLLAKRADRLRETAQGLPWPDNVWMGVTVEDNERLARIDSLRDIPSVVRFLSIEPLLAQATVYSVLEQAVEPCPDEEVLRQQPDLDDMAVIAFFIIFRCRKPA